MQLIFLETMLKLYYSSDPIIHKYQLSLVLFIIGVIIYSWYSSVLRKWNLLSNDINSYGNKLTNVHEIVSIDEIIAYNDKERTFIARHGTILLILHYFEKINFSHFYYLFIFLALM